MRTPPPSLDAAPPRKRGAWVRRWAWRVLLLGVLAVVLALGTIWAALYTQAGTRYAVSKGVAVYAAMIPGDVRVDTVHGALAEGMVLQGVQLSDRFGRPLVHAERLALRVDVPALVGLGVETGTITLEGVELDLTPYLEGGFADLGPEGPAEPTPATPNFGPDLPVRLDIGLAVRDAVIRNGSADPWISVPQLDASLTAEGLVAELALQGRAWMPDQDLFVAWFQTQISWDDPRARIASLLVQSNAGTVTLSDVGVDLAAESFSVRGHAEPSAAWLARNTTLPALRDDAQIQIDGAGATDAMSLDAMLTLPEGEIVAVTVAGALTPIPSLQVLVDAALPAAFPGGATAMPAIDIGFAADLDGDPAHGGELEFSATCEGCISDDAPLSLQAHASAAPQFAYGEASVALLASGVSVRATVDAAQDGMAHAGAQVDIPSLSSLRPALVRVAPDLDLQGALVVTVECLGSLDDARGECGVVVDLSHGHPVETARTQTTVRTLGAEGIEARVDSLLLQARGATVRLLGGPAGVSVSERAVAVSGLRLAVSSGTGAGTLAADGVVGLAGDASLDAHLRVRELNLEVLDAFAPSLQARGVLHAAIDVTGRLSVPRIELSAKGRGLAAKGLGIGQLVLEAQANDTGLRGRLDVSGGDVGTIRTDVALPLQLDLQAGAIAMSQARRARASVSIEGVDLGAVRHVAPTLAPLAGRVDLSTTLAGTLSRPRLEAALDASEMIYDGHVLPAVGLTASYDDGQATASLEASKCSAFDRLAVEASVPLQLDLGRPRVRWLSAQPHRIGIELEGGRIEEVHRWAPEVHAKGKVDLSAALEGTAEDPVLTAVVHATDTYYEHQAVGSLSAKAEYREALATLQLQAVGPAVEGIGLRAQVPVTLSASPGAVQWHSGEPHELDLSINGVHLDRALMWAPRRSGDPTATWDADGLLSAELELRGSAERPAMSLVAEAEKLEYGGRAVGRVTVALDTEPTVAKADVVWRRQDSEMARLHAEVPVAMNLASPTIAWDKARQHRVRLSVPRIDGALLDAFVEAEEFPAAVALELVGEGDLDAFEIGAAFRGIIRGKTGNHAVGGRLDVTQSEQTFSLSLGPHERRWATVRAQAQADVPALLADGDWRTTPVDVRVDTTDLPLSTFEVFLPAEVQAVGGLLTMAATVGGQAGAPQLNGSVKVRGGAATIVPARQRLENLTLSAELSNALVQVHTIRFDSGGGVVKGSGRVEVQPQRGLLATVNLAIDDVPLRSPGLPRMGVTTRVGAEVQMSLDALAVDVRLSETEIDVQTARIAAAQPIPENRNIGFVDFSAPPPREVVPAVEPGQRADGTMSFSVTLADPVKIVGPSVDMSWSGAIKSGRANGTQTTSGKLKAERGFFSLLGNDFDIESGQVTLADDGSNVPFLNLTAKTLVDEMEITASIEGPLPRPSFTLTSSPSLPESEIFTVLVTGSTDTQAADQDDVEAKAASVLAAMANPALQRQLNDRLRVDRVGVGFGESTDQPILTVGKNITKNIYAETEYHHNAPRNENRAQLAVEYSFAPRWSLETFFGDAAAGGVDLFWGRAFDSDAPQAKASEP